jgi:hypothetical protein
LGGSGGGRWFEKIFFLSKTLTKIVDNAPD